MEIQISLKEIPVTLIDGEGKRFECTLKEVDGIDRDRYLNLTGKRARFSGGEIGGPQQL